MPVGLSPNTARISNYKRVAISSTETNSARIFRLRFKNQIKRSLRCTKPGTDT